MYSQKQLKKLNFRKFIQKRIHEAVRGYTQEKILEHLPTKMSESIEGILPKAAVEASAPKPLSSQAKKVAYCARPKWGQKDCLMLKVS